MYIKSFLHRRLFIGGIIDHIEKEDLLPKFSKFGNVTDVWIAHNPPGFAFVEFDNDDSANKAVSEMDGSKLFGGTVKVQITKGRREGRRNRSECTYGTSTCCFADKLYRISWQ